MLKKTITYTDFNGVERTETHYFNLTQADLIEMQYMTPGGFAETLQKAVDDKDMVKLYTIFKNIIEASYGVKSEDGLYFRRSPEEFQKFKDSGAYSALVMELVSSDSAASSFVNAVMPSMDGFRQPAA